MAMRRIGSTVQTSVNLLFLRHFRRVWWRHNPTNKLRIWPALSGVVRKQPDHRFKLFMAIDLLEEVASLQIGIKLGGTLKLTRV
jgi:hypothetical protein